jgi:hypothetical protein
MKLFSTMPMPMPSPGSQITLPVLDSSPPLEALTPEVLPGLSVVLPGPVVVALVLLVVLPAVVVRSPLLPLVSELEPALVLESVAVALTLVVGVPLVGDVVGSTVVDG